LVEKAGAQGIRVGAYDAIITYRPQAPGRVGIQLELHVVGELHLGEPLLCCRSKRLLIDPRWVSTPLAFAGKLPPRRLNS
jgi:hypothetical protein